MKGETKRNMTQSPLTFELLTTDAQSQARRGRLSTRRGVIETPVFMPVGTQGTVKGILPEQLTELGAQIILGNTYHLMLRPSAERISKLGGLHSLMHWDKPILTDSGGYQVFSLAKHRTIDEDGITFRSHLDGSLHRLTPEEAMRVQALLGSDVAMVLDECPPSNADRSYAEQSNELTLRWAARCRARFEETDARDFAIMGCVEATCPGRTGSMSASALQLARLLDITLRNGDATPARAARAITRSADGVGPSPTPAELVGILREAGPMNAGTRIIAFFKDPNGYVIELNEPLGNS